MGRAAVTGKDADRFNFKVPTLRNVDMTYPYFHDGAANTLTQAVDVMGRLQLGRHGGQPTLTQSCRLIGWRGSGIIIIAQNPTTRPAPHDDVASQPEPPARCPSCCRI